jgi:hypothetical protein
MLDTLCGDSKSSSTGGQETCTQQPLRLTLENRQAVSLRPWANPGQRTEARGGSTGWTLRHTFQQLSENSLVAHEEMGPCHGEGRQGQGGQSKAFCSPQRPQFTSVLTLTPKCQETQLREQSGVQLWERKLE